MELTVGIPRDSKKGAGIPGDSKKGDSKTAFFPKGGPRIPPWCLQPFSAEELRPFSWATFVLKKGFLGIPRLPSIFSLGIPTQDDDDPEAVVDPPVLRAARVSTAREHHA